MKRIIKKPDSIIVTERLMYKKGDAPNNRRIREILEEEQDFFCAYTECYIGDATTARDVEHFDNTIKYKDDYQNWFAVSHRWNVSVKKDELWLTFEGNILHPTSESLEKRLWYDEATGCYLHEKSDIEARNLRDYLQINQPQLVEERISHIQLLKDLYEESDIEGFMYWLSYPETKKRLVAFRRAMETVFEIQF